MLSSLPVFVLVAIFVVAAAVVWIAGVKLSDTTDILSERLHLGEALGGLIILAVATNLPETAITVSAALGHHLGIAIGNILGGIAIQTVVLVALDAFGVPKHPLTYRAASLSLVLEGTLVIGVLGIVLTTIYIWGLIFRPRRQYLRMGPDSLAVLLVYIVGVVGLVAVAHG